MKMSTEELLSWMRGRMMYPTGEDFDEVISRVDKNKANRNTVGQFTVVWGIVSIDVDTDQIDVKNIEAPYIIGTHEHLQIVRCVLLSPMLTGDAAVLALQTGVGLLLKTAQFAEDKFPATEHNVEYN